MTPITIGLAGLAVALMALLVLYAAALMVNVIAKAVGGAPVPFASTLAGAITGLLKGAVSFWEPYLKAGLSPLAAVLNFLWRAHSTANAHAQSHAAAINGRVHGVVHVTVPAAKATAIFWAGVGLYREATAREKAVAGAETYAGKLVEQERADRFGQATAIQHGYESAVAAERAQRVAEVQAVVAGLQREIDQVVADARLLAVSDNQAVAAQLAQLRGEVVTSLDKLGAYAGSVGAQVGQYAQTAAGQAESNAVGYANASAAAAVAGLWPGIVAPAEQARQGVAVEAPGVLSGAPAIPQVAPATLAGALAAVATMAATATTFVDECGLGLCSGLGTLARLLNGLADAGLVAALVAIATEELHNPDGAVTAVHDLLDGPVAAVLPVAGAVFGLRLSVP